MKLKIGVIFGGCSVEHELSILTALQAMEQIDTDKYEFIPIYITKDLVWYASGLLRYIDSFNNFNLIDRYATKVNLVNKKGRFVLQTTGLIKRELTEIHLAFPMVHGAGIEDGVIQGYLQMIGIPFVGNNIYSAVVSQDKILSKQILEFNNLPIPRYVWFFDNDYYKDKEALFKKIDKLEYPLIIKPATLGSSVGIEVINRKEELDSTIEKVLRYDRKIIIEEKIKDFLEYNISVLKTNDKLMLSAIEECIVDREYKIFSDNYLTKSEEDNKVKKICPAKLDEKMEADIKKMATNAVSLFNNTGICRVDFLYDKKEKKLYVNEVENIPLCFSHHLWEEVNISYKELLNILIEDTIKNINKSSGKITTIDSNILKNLTTKDIREMK